MQWPNPALWVWVVTMLVTVLGLSPSRADEVHWIGAGALIAWGADETIRGVNPARRVLGLWCSAGRSTASSVDRPVLATAPTQKRAGTASRDGGTSR